MIDVAVEPGQTVDPSIVVLTARFEEQPGFAGSALRRFASTQPAEPAPTMM